MKKLIIPSLILGISFVIACGPSAEEKAAAEQRMKDSIAAVEMAKADSIIAAQQKAMADSIAMADSLRMLQDSIAALAAKPKTKPKAAPAKPQEPPKNIKDAMGKDDDTKPGETKSIKDAFKKPQ